MVPVARAHRGHRRYDADELRRVELLKRLDESVMPIRRMLELARLARRGEATVAARRALLDAHRTEVEAKVAWQPSRPLALYDRALAKG
jgi:DNA-binding transcriptional MerR regulator